MLDDAREHGTHVALDAVRVFHGDAPFELLALPAGDQRSGVLHGVYGDRARLGDDLAHLIDDEHRAGLYVSLHELAPHVVVSDALRAGAGAIAATDVARFRWLYVDVDRSEPLRALGNATDAERAPCLDVACAVADDLGELGAPANSMGIMQGANGAAVVVRIALPAPGGRKLLDASLRALGARHNTAAAIVDLAPSGPTAHVRLPGSIARKHPPTPGRPWHACWLLRAPDRECLAPVAVLERLAARDPRRSRPISARRTMRAGAIAQPPAGVTLDALRRYADQWGVRREHASGAATVLELERCPYSSHRSPGKAYLSHFGASGRWEPGCHSPKCAGLSWRWMTDAFGQPK
jgi:hypothetical protein